MILALLPVRVHPQHESCCPFLCWRIHSKCFMLHYTAGRSWGSGHLSCEMKLDLMESWVNRPLISPTLWPPRMCCCGVSSSVLEGCLVCSGRKGISTANNSLPGGGRAYGMKLLPNAKLVAFRLATFTSCCAAGRISRKRWMTDKRGCSLSCL